MAIIGQSKNKGLYEKVTKEGSKYRDLKYADLGYSSMWDGQPVLHGYIPEKPGQMLGSDAVSLLRTEGIPPVTQGRTDVDLKSNVLLPVTARIDDTERITRLLTKVPGIKWEAHNAELGAIQSNLERKRSKYTAGSSVEGTGLWNTLAQIGQNLVQGLLGALDVTGTTLAQVAVAGTGEHFSSWILANRSYIGKSAAELALASGVVPVNLGELGYFQLPGSENQAIKDAQQPKMRGTKLPDNQKSQNGKSWDTYNYYGNGDDQAKNYEQRALESEERYKTFGPGEGYSLQEDSEEIKEAQRPRPGRNGILAKTGEEALQGIPEHISRDLSGMREFKGTKKVGKNPNLLSYLEYSKAWDERKVFTDPLRTKEEDYLYISGSESKLKNARELKTDRPEGLPVFSGSIRFDPKVNELSPESQSYVAQHPQLTNSYFASGSRPYNGGSVSGPWKHDGAHALRAGTAGSKDPNHAQDGGQSNYDSRENMPIGDNVHTRVDNGRIDMIPFWIRAISPDGTVMDNAYLFFEANLDSYTDNYDATWESTQYLGRADKFWTYSGFDRQISFSFKMVAHTKSHLKPIYNRLNGLLSMTTPSYGNGGTFMQGVLAEVTIGDLLSKQLGFIKSVGLKWETDYMWEIDGSTTIRVPHVLDVSVGFTPIHQFIPQLRQRYFNLAGDGLTKEMTKAGNTFGLFTANAQGKNGYNLYN